MNNLIGQKFNKLLVLSKASSNRQGSITWLCRCDCGKEKIYSSDHLTRKINAVKSCGCNKNRKGKDNPLFNGVGKISGSWWWSHVLRERTQEYRKKVPVTVSINEAWDLLVKQNFKCALSGLPIEVNGNHINNTASIDRIDSSKGYEINNIQWVHKHVNFMKRTYSQEYFISLCKLIAKNFGV